MKHSKSAAWLATYELVYIIMSTFVGLALHYSSKASPIESLSFIKSRSMLIAVLHIWLNNTASFLIEAVFVVLSPVLGVLAVTFTSISSGQLLASWVANYCSTSHFIYGNIETQAYIILWVAVARTYYAQNECSDLMCR
ncbi:MAG: hypothetical protein GSR79_09755 [Desulfurococcales archaeon]|nr:hypothetical protein [Desulfurococcales archaeon]